MQKSATLSKHMTGDRFTVHERFIPAKNIPVTTYPLNNNVPCAIMSNYLFTFSPQIIWDKIFGRKFIWRMLWMCSNCNYATVGGGGEMTLCVNIHL